MTTEELRRWAVEQALASVVCDYDSHADAVIGLAQRIVDFVAPPDAGPATMPADFGKRAPSVFSRDAMAERQAIALWLGGAGLSWAAKRVTAGDHHQ